VVTRLKVTDTIDTIEESIEGLKISLELVTRDPDINVAFTEMYWRVSYEGTSATTVLDCACAKDGNVYMELMKLVQKMLPEKEDNVA
jgi:hypothetical protein